MAAGGLTSGHARALGAAAAWAAMPASAGLADVDRIVGQRHEVAAGCQPVTAEMSAIVKPGRYCLDGDQTRPAGLRILSDDVTLDLAGHCLRGAADPGSVEAGIRLPYSRRRVAIRNGCVTGFMYAVLGDDPAGGGPPSEGIVVSGMRLSNNWFRGVMIAGNRVEVSRTVVTDIGGTTVHEDAYAIGIEVRGDHCEIVNNRVADVYPTGSGEGVGISVTNDDVTECLVAGNVLENSTQPVWGRTFGIWAKGRARVRDNVAINHTFNIAVWDPARVSGNVSVQEACLGYSGSLARSRTDTVFLPPGPEVECSQSLEVALRRVEKGHRDSLFGVAAIYHTNADYRNAVVYYHAAAVLGSAEARRQIDRFLELGLVTRDDVEVAVTRARQLDLF